MATYKNPIGAPNPFFVKPPLVIALRHVRVIMLTGEVVKEDANSLPRQFARRAQYRTYPQPVAVAPPQRNIPDSGNRKVDW